MSRKGQLVALTAGAAAVFVAVGLAVEAPPDDALAEYVSLVALNTLPLLFLDRNPLAVVGIFAIAYPLYADAGFGAETLQSLPTVAALYATGAWDRPLWLRSLALLSPVWMMGAAIGGLWDVDVVNLWYVAAVFVIVWTLGVVVAGRRHYAAQLERRTTELEAARRELANRAVADERARIARELHDVIAHAMSVITVQAGVGAHLSNDTSPQSEALRVIERTGREALVEMRRMLTVLRSPGDADRRPEPQPGVVDLPLLIDRARRAGVAVQFDRSGREVDLPAGLDLAIYRIVQEALTNIAKHSASSPAAVALTYSPQSVHVAVSNATTEKSFEVGQGLTGMAERVALYDGTLETTADGDSFRVAAHFPLESTS